MMKIVLIVLLSVFVIRLLTNIYRLLATKFYYYAFLNKSSRMDEFSKPIGVLFQKAGTQTIAFDHNGLLRFQDYISNQLSEPTNRSKLCKIFEQTIGVYRFRIRQNFYPLFWLTLPAAILNIQKSKLGGLCVNILFWLAGVVGAYFLEKFLDTTPLADGLLSFLGR